jgi:ATP-dependent DNA helicase RecG
MNKLRVFVSSVQKEMEPERVAVASLITTDPFLMRHCEPVLFEKEPVPAHPSKQPYLECLRSCQIYLLLIHNEYGRPEGHFSATHHEFREAQARNLPTLVFVKGNTDDGRKPETRAFMDEIRKNKHTYRRFIDREDLKPELRKALLNLLKQDFKLAPSADEATGGREQIAAASAFEARPLPDVPWSTLDSRLMSEFAESVVTSPGIRVFDGAACAPMHARGLLWRDEAKTDFFATAAGLLLFGARPADRFPQAEILADAYADTNISGKPRGQLNINAAIPLAILQVLEFVDKHTFHPRRVVGINNIALDEYPKRALREALVNAVAHRNYEDGSRKITVQVFADRIVVASPGYPPSPLTLAKLRKGNYRPCSRNPVLAQTLATLNLMEQRGSGFARMRDAMLDHGLDAPSFAEEDGYFVVTFAGPSGNYARLKVQEGATGIVTPSIESQLSPRQRKMVGRLARGEELTSRECQRRYKVSAQALHRDFQKLVSLGLAKAVGSGRSARYILKSRA